MEFPEDESEPREDPHPQNQRAAVRLFVGLLVFLAGIVGVFMVLAERHREQEVLRRAALLGELLDPASELPSKGLLQTARAVSSPVEELCRAAQVYVVLGDLDAGQVMLDRALALRTAGLGNYDSGLELVTRDASGVSDSESFGEWTIELVRAQDAIDRLRAAKGELLPRRWWVGANPDEITYERPQDTFGNRQLEFPSVDMAETLALGRLEAARRFEELGEAGRALDTYRELLTLSRADDPWRHDARTAISRLEPLEPLPRSSSEELFEKLRSRLARPR